MQVGRPNNCGTLIYTIAQASFSSLNGYMSRTYTGFATHDITYYSFGIFLGGQWQASDTFSVEIDGQLIKTFVPYSFASFFAPNACVGAEVSLKASVVGKKLHTASSVTITISWSFTGSGSPAPSIGIRNLQMLFATKTALDSEEIYTTIPQFIDPSNVICPNGQYSSQSSSVCTTCTSECLSCFGPSSTQCYGLTSTYSFDGSQTQVCPPPCQLCDGTNTCYSCLDPYQLTIYGECQMACPTPSLSYGVLNSQTCLIPCNSNAFMLWNGTCVSTCNAPLVEGQIAQGKICRYPCGLSTKTFLYWNGSCLSTCPYYTRSDNQWNFCDTCQPGYYMYDTGVSLPYCSSLIDIANVGGSNFCHNPCRANEFLYADKSCRSTCNAPYIQTMEQNIHFCISCSYPYTIRSSGSCELNLSKDETKQANAITDALNKPDDALDAGAGLATLLASHDPSMFCFISFTKMLFYIRYMNIAYSPMLQKILNHQTLGRAPLGFIRIAGEKVGQHCEKHALPQNFERYHFHSSFIVNFWSPLVLSAAILCALFLVWVIVVFTKKYKRINSVCNKVQDAVKWNFCMTFMLSHYDGIVLFGSFEFRTMNLQYLLPVFSFLTALLSNITILVTLIIAANVIYQLRKLYRNSLNSLRQLPDAKHKYRAYKVYFELFRDSSAAQQAFLVIFSCKVYIFYLVVAYLFAYPLLQAILIVLLSVLMMVYLIAKYPLKHKVKLAQYIVLEAVLLVANICVLISAVYDHRHIEAFDRRNILGNIIIYCNIALRVLGPIFIVLQALDMLKTAYDDFNKRKLKNSASSQHDGARVAEQEPTKEVATILGLHSSIVHQNLERSDLEPINLEPRSNNVSFEQHFATKLSIQNNRDESNLNISAQQEDVSLKYESNIQSRKRKIRREWGQK